MATLGGILSTGHAEVLTTLFAANLPGGNMNWWEPFSSSPRPLSLDTSVDIPQCCLPELIGEKIDLNCWTKMSFFERSVVGVLIFVGMVQIECGLSNLGGPAKSMLDALTSLRAVIKGKFSPFVYQVSFAEHDAQPI